MAKKKKVKINQPEGFITSNDIDNRLRKISVKGSASDVGDLELEGVDDAELKRAEIKEGAKRTRDAKATIRRIKSKKVVDPNLVDQRAITEEEGRLALERARLQKEKELSKKIRKIKVK